MLVHFNMLIGPMSVEAAERVMWGEEGEYTDVCTAGSGCIVLTAVYDWVAAIRTEQGQPQIPRCLANAYRLFRSEHLEDDEIMRKSFAAHISKTVGAIAGYSMRYPEFSGRGILIQLLEHPDCPDCPHCTERTERLACMCGHGMLPGEKLYECAMVTCPVGRWHLKCMKQPQPPKEPKMPRLDPVTNQWDFQEQTPGQESLGEGIGKLYCPSCLEQLKGLAAQV